MSTFRHGSVLVFIESGTLTIQSVNINLCSGVAVAGTAVSLLGAGVGAPAAAAGTDARYDAEDFDFQGPTTGTKFIMNHGSAGLEIYLMTILPDGMTV